MNVLSLFDGISCGQLALAKAGIKVDQYFASEINHDAMKVTDENFPYTMQIGPVEHVGYEIRIERQSGVLYGKPGTSTGASWPTKIDLLIGGSPCQGFSQASSKKEGLEDPRSKLFWEYIRIREEVKPRWFLLENVRMDSYSMSVVTEAMGVTPVLICSSLFVPQFRKRWYWTNIPIPRLPSKRDYDLKDVITSGYVDRATARCLLESDSRPNTDMRRLFRRYKRTGFNNIVYEREDMCPLYIRILNQTELERLQGVPEGYTGCHVRNVAAGLLGNGWTVPVLAHIFEGMLSDDEYLARHQLSLWDKTK